MIVYQVFYFNDNICARTTYVIQALVKVVLIHIKYIWSDDVCKRLKHATKERDSLVKFLY